MKFTPAILCLAVISLLAGCSSMKVSSEAEPSYHFNSIETYQWVDAPADILNRNDTYLSMDMQKALNNELAAKGWQQILDSTNATIQATYFIKLKAHEEYTEAISDSESEFAGGLVYRSGTHKLTYEQREPEQNVYTIEVATLHFSLTDTTTGKGIWNGTAQTKLDRSQPTDKTIERFQQIAHKLAEQIP